MGPISRYLGPEVPNERLIWQDPVPEVNHELINKDDIKYLKKKISCSGLSVSQLVSTAWASASTFRGSDKRGGANGARIRLEPQKNWEVNKPEELNNVLEVLECIKDEFNSLQTKSNEYYSSGCKRVSLADIIILGGCVGIEIAAKKAGYKLNVPFTPGRMDTSQEYTDIESFAVLEPKADGFRNYIKSEYVPNAEEFLIDRAQLLTLTAPEMTVLIGGMRVLNTNYDNSDYGVFTNKPETLTNDYFVNLLDMNTVWKPTSEDNQFFEGRDRKTGKLKWKGSRVDLLFGSNSQLRAIAEVYASEGCEHKFLKDFVCAWNKVMNADRYDVRYRDVPSSK